VSYQIISERTHKALKRYRCIWCGELILPGASYVREFSVYNGNTQKHAWHPECKDAASDWHLREGETEFIPWENERPPSFSEQEYRSWDCALLAQGRIAP